MGKIPTRVFSPTPCSTTGYPIATDRWSTDFCEKCSDNGKVNIF